MRAYASSRVKRKSFYRKSKRQMFLLISGGHIGVPKRCTNMASPEADPGGGLRGLQPPPFGKFSNLSGYPCLSLFQTKNNIISYSVSSSPIDHYKMTVAFSLFFFFFSFFFIFFLLFFLLLFSFFFLP